MSILRLGETRERGKSEGKTAQRRKRSQRRRVVRTIILLAVLALGAGGALYLFGPEPAADVGRPAPPFALPDAAGRTVSVADLLGRQPVVLVFYMFAG